MSYMAREVGLHMSSFPGMVTIYTPEDERIRSYYAGTYATVWKLYTSYTDQLNRQTRGYFLILSHLVDILVQDGLVHIYDLQTGQWTSSFQAASDTVNGFSFHPFLPMAASSSGERRFGIPDDCSDDFKLGGITPSFNTFRLHSISLLFVLFFHASFV